MSVDATQWRERIQPIVFAERTRDTSHDRRILLAEDNLVNQKVARGTLERMGYKVDIVNNGVEAVAAWETGRYHLILMDCQMPVMDGYQATGEIRQRESHSSHAKRIAIIALTADAMKGAEQRCREAGMDGYLTKPLDRARLGETVERHLVPLGVGSDAVETGRHSLELPSNAQGAVEGDAPVDWERFMLGADGDREFAGEMVQLFIDSGDATLRDISAALVRGDLAAIGRAAHSFKGSSASMRAQSVSAAASRLEEAARAGAVDQISQLEEQLRQEAARAAQYLRARQAQ
jgi:CheY-like chemotaxis protein